MPERWADGDPSDTGVPLDTDYCAAHETERTVSVGYSAGEKPRTPDGQPLATEEGDGSASESDAWIDGNSQQHTAAGESQIIGTTFYADDAGDTAKFSRLWLLHSGKDKHKRGDGSNINPRHQTDSTARFNHERAEIICDRVALSPAQKRAVLSAVDSTNFARLTYLCQKADDGYGAVEVSVVGVLACVLAYWVSDPLSHPAITEAAEIVGVNDVKYVVNQVAEKMQFAWIEDGVFS